jgi:hypothetical protein
VLTLDGHVKCVLHKCMKLEAAPGCVRVRGADAGGPVPCRHVVVSMLPSIS